jgi:hypothetical protein
MGDPNALRGLCLDESGSPKSKHVARAAIINHLILEEMTDIDDAADLADAALRESGLWPDPPAEPSTADH